MKKICLFVLLLGSVFAFAKELSSVEFLKYLQDASKYNGSTYGVLEGLATHIRRENNRKIIEEYPCFMAVVITPGKSITQIIIDKDEAYLVGRVQGESTSVRKTGKKSGIMERIGVSPRDLAMSFLDGEFVRELEGESVRMAQCRVLLLHDKKQNEWVRIYAAKDYFFVLKAEFFKHEPNADTRPDRILEVSSFAKKNELYYTRSLEISGQGWRTDIEFDKADMNIYDPGKRTEIFRTLK